MENPKFVYEDIETTPRRQLFSLLGVPWLVTPLAWIGPVTYGVFGLVVAFLTQPDESVGMRILMGSVFGVLVGLTEALHSIGHILGGKAVGAPMRANLVTATRHINLYDGPQDHYPRRVHLGRASGGPLMNISAGIVSLILWGLFGGSSLVFFAAINLFLGLASLLPLRSVDGEVIWRELRS